MMARRAITQHAHEQGTAHARTVKHGVSRLLPYAPPWLIWFGILAIAVVGHWLWGGSALYPMGAMLAHQGAMVITWKLTKTLNEVLRLLALASIAASMIFVIAVGVLGPNAVMVSLWGGVGFTLCVYWSIRRMLLTATNSQTVVAEGSPLAKLMTALNGAKVGTPIIEDGQVTVELEANRGVQSLDDLQGFVKATEQVVGMRPGAGQLIKSQDDSGRATARFMPVDVLKGIVPWLGPSAFGKSIADAPITIGKYSAKKTAQVWLTGDEATARPLAQWLVMGMSGAGKSEFFRMMSAEMLSRRDVTLWVHDHEKGLQTLRPVIEGGGPDWVSMTKPTGLDMLAATKRVIEARSRWMGANGFDNWVKDCGLNLLVVWIEEATSLARLKDLFELVRLGRSVGVVIFISLQRASHTVIDTDTRAQLAGNICFGVESNQDARFGLPDHVLEGIDGNGPETWRNERPGYAYVAAPGIEPEMQKTEMRMCFARSEDVTNAIVRAVAVRQPLDEISQVAAGKVYEKRLPCEAYRSGHPQFEQAIGMKLNVGRMHDTANDSGSDSVDRGSDSVDRPVSGGMLADDEEEVTVDRSQFVPVDMPMCPAPEMGARDVVVSKMTTEQCRSRVQEYLERVCDEGRSVINVPDIVNMTPPIPRKREWIRAELKRLCTDDADPEGWRLRVDEYADAGAYRIVEPTGRDNG